MGVVEAFAKVLGLGAEERPAAFSPSESSSSRVQELWAKDSAARRPMEQQWQLQASMVMGNQYCGWNGTGVVPLAAPSWRIQAVENMLFVRTRSKMTSLLVDSTPQFLPETAEHLDIRRARYKERVLSHIHREINLDQIKARAAQWSSVLGEVYLEAYWDETAGDCYADDAGAISLGEAGVKVWSPFEVWVGVGACAGNNAGRMWTAEIVPVELARLKYNTIPNISPDAAEMPDMQLRASMDTFFQPGSVNTTGSTRKNLEESVMVKTLREYRTRANPQGRISTIINGKVIDEQPLLWDGMCRIINFPAFSSWYGDAVELRLSIQRQKSYNRLLSNWEEYVRTMCKGKILTHKSNKIKSSQFDAENAEVVTWEGAGMPPTPWMPPPMPSDTQQLLQLNKQAIEDLYSDHMASQGRAPASASGSAINYLIESDQTQHTLTRDLWNAGWSRCYEKLIDVVAGRSGKGGYTEDRVITILGENRRADVQPVDMALLEGKNRVTISVGGSLPTNKTLRAEVVRRWFTDGALGDPAEKSTRRKFLKMTDAGILDDVFDDEALDEIRAEGENERLAMGEVVPVNPEDGHDVHAYSHKHYMKSDEFLNADVEVRELFYDHLGTHEERMLPPMPGQPPGAPPPPAPNGGKPPLPGPASSPAVSAPADILKSVAQGGEPPPAVGAPGL